MKIYKKDIMFALFAIAVCIPQGIASIGVVSPIATMIRLVFFIYAIMLMLKGQVGIDRYFVIWICYFAALLVSTVINSGNFAIYVSKYYPLFTAIVMIKYYTLERKTAVLKIVSYIFTILVLLNSVMGVMYTTVLMSTADVFILGIRTRINDLAYIAVSMGGLVASLYRRERKLIIISVLSSLYFIVTQEVTTGYICLPIVILIIFLAKSKCFRISDHGECIYWGIVILNLLIISGQLLSSMGWFFADVLGEDITLTGRTNIWGSVLANMPGKWILGHGIGSVRRFEVVTNYTTATHNQLLNELYNGGLITLILFLLIGCMLVKQCQLYKHRNSVYILSGVISMQIAMISEVVCDSTFYNVFMIACYYYLTNYTDRDGGITEEYNMGPQLKVRKYY